MLELGNHLVASCGTIGNMMNRCGWCSLFSELEAVGQASWKSPSPLSTSTWDSVVPKKKRQHHTIRCPLDAAVGKLRCSQGFWVKSWCHESKYVKMWEETTEIGQVWCCFPKSLGYCMLSARVLHFPTVYSTSFPNSVDDVLQLLGCVPIFPLISPCAIFYSRFSSWIIPIVA